MKNPEVKMDTASTYDRATVRRALVGRKIVDVQWLAVGEEGENDPTLVLDDGTSVRFFDRSTEGS